jgi:formiminoglutamase
MSFKATPASVFQSKNDPEDLRIGDFVAQKTGDFITQGSADFVAQGTTSSASGPQFYLRGFNDDEGIALNGGRIGARLAPNTIRNFLFKMTPDSKVCQSPLPFQISDLGNLEPEDLTLEQRYQLAIKQGLEVYSSSGKLISFGAGHDYGYADAKAFIANKSSADRKKPIVINFDAHLDVRPLSKGMNSGTPFRRLLQEHPGQFDFYEIGIQPQCNSAHHLKWLESQKGTVFSLEQCKRQGLLQILQGQFDMDEQDRPTFVSLDIDVFKTSEAPGCSQSWPWGLSSEAYFESFQFLSERLDIQGLGIYEVSPPLDIDGATSKLAALAAWSFLFQSRFVTKAAK